MADDFNYWDVDNNVPDDMTAPLQAVNHGYAFVEMNERGRFFSEGTFDILGPPRSDGDDAIDLDRSRRHPPEQDYQDIVTMGLLLSCSAMTASRCRAKPLPLQSDPERGEECRRGKGVSQILD